jgi:hypothetical protein
MDNNHLSDEVTTLLDSLEHPLRDEIESLRKLILRSKYGLTEGIKWNGPNYKDGDSDRITMRIHPPKQLQLIFHRGAKVMDQPEGRLLEGKYSFLVWKENDRAIATFKDKGDIEQHADELAEVVDAWIEATRDKQD